MEGLNSNTNEIGDSTLRDGEDRLDSAYSSAEENDERIFRSSLCGGMFREPQSSKTDACAVFCCGVYLWQRNQDILMRERRKEEGFANHDDDNLLQSPIASTISKRPLDALFLLLAAVAIIIWSFDTNSLLSTIGFGAVCLLILLAIWKIFRFQQARKSFRRQLAIAEYCRRRNCDIPEDEGDPGLALFLQEHRQGISEGGSHNLLGCASSNGGWFGNNYQSSNQNHENDDSTIEDDDDDDDGDENNNSPRDFCLEFWRFLGKLCCGMLCGCHLQLFGMCAIAQESRHLREAIPTTTRPGLWQRDYITMQPWMEYYPSILRLRLSNQIHCIPHFKALSRLSRRLLITGASVFLFVTLMFLLPIRFPKWQVVVLYGTFLQPAVFLFFVHWLWNRLDISVDAVVKYFACGFFICTSSAIVYEWLVSQLAQIFILLLDRLGTEALEIFGNDDNHLPGGNGHAHSSYIVHPLWYRFTKALLTAFVNAFFVAGMTEEICKYLCFWMVEHPDLEIQNRVMLPTSTGRGETGRQPEISDHEDSETTRLLSREPSNPSDPEQQTIFAPTAPLASLGEAITVAMVALALGFACAENLLYIFVYTTPGFREEIGTLYVRCLFPIHPMTAALQSIGVCRRDLEKDSSVGIGRILLPAWLLHGFFDFSLMAYSTIKEISTRHNFHASYDTPPTDTPRIEPGGGNPVDADQGQPILMYVMFVPFVAMMYFMNESFYQRERLEKLDRENRIQRSTGDT